MGQEYEKNPYAYGAQEDESSEKRKKKRAILISLLIATAGAILATMRINRGRRLVHFVNVIEPLQQEWAKAKGQAENPPIRDFNEFDSLQNTPGTKLLRSLSEIKDKVDKNNADPSLLGYEVTLEEVIPPYELRDTLRSAAGLELRAIAAFSESDLLWDNSDEKVVKLAHRISLLPKLAAAGGMTADQLLGEFGGEKDVQQTITKKCQMMWTAVQAGVKRAEKLRDEETKRARIERDKQADRLVEENERLLREMGPEGFNFAADIDNEMDVPNNQNTDTDPDGPREPQVGELAVWLSQIANAAGIKREDLKISDKDVRQIFVPQIKALWEQRGDLNRWEDRRAEEILALAQFAGVKPESVLGEKPWREFLGKLALQASKNCDELVQKNEPRWKHREEEQWQRVQMLLKHGNLQPFDPEAQIPPEVWNRLMNRFGEPGEKGAQVESKAEQVVVAAHRNFLFPTFDQMSKNAPLVLTVETATVVASFFTAAPVFTAALSLVVTVKLAQLTGAAINSLLDRKSHV